MAQAPKVAAVPGIPANGPTVDAHAVPGLEYTRGERLILKGHGHYNETWVRDRIEDKPGILGLGEDLVVLDTERRQESGGRLDLLLYDPEEERRYEVELMLGALDESHIVRAIEYWDVERRRYPGYEHCPVIVAEDITSRFLNVLGLFDGTIPIIALQMRALKVHGNIILDFAPVINRVILRKDDQAETKIATVDRSFWEESASQETVSVADRALEIINVVAKTPQILNYNKHYIGLTDGVRSRNFVHFKPKKQFTHILVEIADPDAWKKRLEEDGLPAEIYRDRLRVTVRPGEFTEHKQQLTELIQDAVKEYQQD